MATHNFDTDQAIIDSVKFANVIRQTYGRSSLTRNAKDTIAQYPVIFSASIPLDDAVIVAKALELQYAALLISVISANSDYDRGRYNNPSEYLKNFYSNRDSALTNIPGMLPIVESQLPDDFTNYSVESTLCRSYNDDLVAPEVTLECWLDSEIQFDQTFLNHAYRPETATQKAMEAVVENLRKLHTPAMEAPIDEVLGKYKSRGVNTDDLGSPVKAGEKTRVVDRGKVQVDKDGNVVRDAKGKPYRYNEEKESKEIRRPAVTGMQGLSQYSDKLGNMAPTMVNVQLVSHHGNAPVITHNVVVGVKAMIRLVPQDLMISNLAEGISDTRGMFKFIKWTEGTYKFLRDFVLGIDNAKAEAASSRDMKNWLQGLKRKKRANLISRMMSGTPMPPMTTIVTTSYEVARVAEETGLDLNEAFNAVKLISKYYLLGLIIYEPETGNIKSIFDGDTTFSSSTVSGLKTQQQKELDINSYSKFLRAAGRM